MHRLSRFVMEATSELL